MDKLKYIKLENEDGSYSSSIALSVDANNIETQNGTSNLENDLNSINTNLNLKTSQIEHLEIKTDNLVNGAPLVASSISEMTDTTRIYVNTTDGHWYWHNGNSWEDGGVYQASENSNDLNDVINYIDDYKIKNLHKTLTDAQLTQNGGGKYLFNTKFSKGFLSKIKYQAISTGTAQNIKIYLYKKISTGYELIETIKFTAQPGMNYININKFINNDFYVGIDTPYYMAYKSTVTGQPNNVSNVTTFTDTLLDSQLNFNHYYEFGIDILYSVADEINSLAQLIDINKERKYLFLGDSYSVGWTPDGNVKS